MGRIVSFPPRSFRDVPWTRLLLVVVCAAFAFGGTFTCKGSTHDDDDRPPRSARR